MANESTCLKCGAPLTADARDGVCPMCLLGQALAADGAGAAPAGPSEMPGEQPVPEAGDRVGRYKLLQKIGEGGCGLVYMAEQEEPVRRRVALKVIKLGMDTREVIARFEAERQALALMDHPNIAKVFDGGATDTGRPYFVMELVRGIRITDFCNQNNYSTRQRLDLFMQVCQAVQHAHQKGIIHRDLKPSNILVSINDGVPVPKVIDFGIAKATAQRLTDKTLFTRFHQFIGTPAYMSPEQAEMTSLDIDTRSDIYSLGVLLYELLTGKTPFDSKELLQAGLDEMRRVIREQEPMRPSTRLSTMLEAERTTTAKLRQIDPRKLINLVSGDLDWIVMKCLEKDRARRYETASSLAMDIARHLNNEPVTAAAPSAVYRVRKFVRRHRAALAIVTSMVLLLLLGMAGITWQAVRATQAERAAIAEALGNDRVVHFLGEMLQGVRPSVALGRDTTLLREIVDKAAERAGKELKDPQRAAATVRNTIGGIYRDMGDYSKAEAMFREALAIEKKLHGLEHPHVAGSLNNLASVLLERGKLDEAETMHHEALAMQKKLLGPEHRDVAVSLNNLASVLLERGKVEQAELLYREALALMKKLFGPESENVAGVFDNLGGLLASQGKLAEAEAMFRDALAMRRKLLGDGHPDVAGSLNNLGSVLMEQGKLNEAEKMLREALVIKKKLLGDEHPEIAGSLNNLGTVLMNQDKLNEAEKMLLEALAMRKKLLGDEHPEIAAGLNNLGAVLMEEGKLKEAEKMVREALEMGKKLLGDEHPKVADSLYSLAAVLVRQGNSAEAEAISHAALAMRKKLLGDEHPEVAASLDGLAAVISNLGKLAEAEPMFRDALAMRKKLLGDEHPSVAAGLNNLGGVLLKQGRLEEAEGLYREALAMRKKLLGPEHRHVAVSLNALASVLLEQRKLEEAEAAYREALAIEKHLLGPEDKDVARSLCNLAVVLKDRGRLAEAETLCREALAMQKELLGPEHLDVARSLNNLGDVLLNQGKLEEAEPLFREALAIRRKLSGNEHPDLADSLHNLAVVLKERGRLAEADTLYREALAMQRKLLGSEHLDVARSLNGLGGVLLNQARLEEAESVYREALAMRRKLLGSERVEVSDSLGGLAGVLEKLGRLVEAEPLYLEGNAIRQQNDHVEPKHKREAIEFLWHFYTKWSVAAPGTGKMQKALEWRKKLTEFDAVSEQKGLAEAQTPLLRAKNIPGRDPKAKPNLVNLEQHFNAGLKRNWHGDVADNSLEALPTGVQMLGGTEFDVRGLVQVRFAGRAFPREVIGIAVGQRCERLHFLHAAVEASRSSDGTQIGRYVIRFADGQQHELPIIMGKELADWFEQPGETNKSFVVAWTGENAKSRREKTRIRLFKTTWENPHPDVAVQTIDFVAMDPKASPFLVAITADP